MSNQVKLFSDILSEFIANSSYSTNTQFDLKTAIDAVSYTIPVELDDVYRIKNIPWFDKITSESIYTLEGLRRIAKLHDGTFAVMAEDTPIKHLGSAFGLIGELPFDNVATAGGNLEAYVDPSDITAVKYVFENETGSFLLVTLPAQHIVQVYRYTAGVWTFAVTIGELDTGGAGPTQLNTPRAAAGILNTAGDAVEVYVSSHGAASNGQISNIRQFTLTPDNTISVGTEVSFPQQVISTGNSGSLLAGETSLITKIKVDSAGKLWVISESEDEFGLLNISGDLPVTEKMTKGTLGEISYGDVIGKPVAFDIAPGYIITGDASGHISVLSPDLGSVVKHTGKFKVEGSVTTYPGEYSVIEDTCIDGTTLYFVTDNQVYKTNLLQLNAQEMKFLFPDPGFDYSLRGIYGVPAFLEVKYSINNIDYYSLDYFYNKEIKRTSALYIKLSATLDSLLNNDMGTLKLLMLISL